MVNKEVGQPHEVLTPCQHDAQDGCSQQAPRQRLTVADEQAQHKEHQHKGSHIDGTHGAVGALLHIVVPVLRKVETVLAQVVEHLWGRHHLTLAHVDAHILDGVASVLIVKQQVHRCAALYVGHQQRPCLADAVAVVRDIRALQSAVGLVLGIGLHQLALAAHGLLRILPCVVQVREVHHHTQQTTHDAYARSLHKAHIFLLQDSFYEEGQYHQQDDHQVVIRHLHVVGVHHKGCKEGCHDECPQVLAPIGQHYAANHWGQIGQRHHLPQVSGSNDNQEIGAESPKYRAQRCQLLTEIEGAQHDVEAQQIDKQIPHIVGQPQVIGILHLRQQVRTLIRW